MQFDTPLLSRQYTSSRGVVPELSDRELWSVVLMSKKYATQPDVVYGLITSAGNRYVDNSSNQFIAIS